MVLWIWLWRLLAEVDLTHSLENSSCLGHRRWPCPTYRQATRVMTLSICHTVEQTQGLPTKDVSVMQWTGFSPKENSCGVHSNPTAPSLSLTYPLWEARNAKYFLQLCPGLYFIYTPHPHPHSQPQPCLFSCGLTGVFFLSPPTPLPLPSLSLSLFLSDDCIFIWGGASKVSHKNKHRSIKWRLLDSKPCCARDDVQLFPQKGLLDINKLHQHF